MAKKSERNPWLSIWVQPRETIREIIDSNPNYKLFVLCALYGFPMAMSFAQSFSLCAKFPAWSIVLAGLILCTFLGFIGISICSWLLHVTGKWIRGKGTFQAIRAHGGIGRYRNGIFEVFSTGIELNLKYYIDNTLSFIVGGGWNLGGWILIKDKHNEHAKYFNYNGAPYAQGKFTCSF